MLELIKRFRSDHLIKAIAYYRHDEYHYFMFPWAEYGNLWEFWDNQASLEKPYLVWVFQQLHGLAAAIEELHGQTDSMNCRHGDLKPENILCFRDTGRKDNSRPPTPRMVITDVGLAKRHNEATQLRQATNTKVSTKRYAAPEMETIPNGVLSRRFDIWSTGCIFLEFVIWILYGRAELDRCTKANSTFYQIVDDQGGRITAKVHPTVKGWISYIRKDWRCLKGTALGRLIDLIDNKLLVVNVLGSASLKPQAHLRIIEPSEQSKSRTYAPGMREELQNILTSLREGTINAIGARPTNDSGNPQGPSHSRSTTHGGMLAVRPDPSRVR